MACLRALIPLVLVGPALAQPAPSESPPVPPANPWTINFEPAAWYVSPGGDMRLPGAGAQELDMSDLNLDSPRLSPFGELRIQKGDWSAMFSGVAFSMGDRGAIATHDGQVGSIPFSTGDRLASSLDFTTFEGAGLYRFYNRPRGPRRSGRFDFEPTWQVMGGLRIYEVSSSVEAPGGVADADAFFAEPFAGLRFAMDLAEDFTIDLHATFGGFTDGDDRTTVSWDIITGFQWRPAPNFGLQFGYRQLAFLLEDGGQDEEFRLRGALAGLYFGAVLRF